VGWLMKGANACIAFVGLDPNTAKRLRPILLKTGLDDPGRIELHDVRTVAQCRELLDTQALTGICIDVRSFSASECVAFIADIRTTHPLVTFCLVGKSSELRQLPGFHQNWRERFRHYFQLRTDASDEDFEQNAGALRDLLVADVVKCKALGQYQTTPGALIRLKAASPYGFWLSLIVVAATALLAGAIGPFMDRYFPVDRGQAAEPRNNNAGQPGASEELQVDRSMRRFRDSQN
jgi:hypothetical protein